MQDKLAFAELIYDSTHDMMFIMSVRGEGVYITESVNRAYLEVRGFELEDLIGKQPHEIRTAEEAVFVVDRFEQLILKKEPISYTEKIQLAKGMLHAETKLSAIYDDAGKPTHILGVSRDITEQASKTQLLEERNTQLNAIFEHAPVEMFIKNLQGQFLKVNKQYEKTSGIKSTDIVNKNLEDVFGSKLAHYMRERDRSVVESRASIRKEEKPRRLADGTEHVFYTVQFPIFDKEGDVSGTGAVINDITELKNAQALTSLAQENFKQMFNVAPIGMALVEPMSGRVLEANNQYLDILGRTRAELGELNIDSMTHPEELEQTKLNAQLIQSGETRSYKRLKRYLHTDGSTIWVHLDVEVLAAAPSDTEPKVLVMLQDISKHKESEAELAYKTSLLVAQQESTVEGIITVNSENVVLTYNQKFIELWDISPEVIALNSGRVALKDILSKVVDPSFITQKIRQSSTHLNAAHTDEVELLDGRVFEIRRTAMLGFNDQFYGWLWSTRDLTQVKLQEEQVRRSMKMNALAMLTAGITHDYSNMLSVILGYAELIAHSKGETEEQIQEYLTQIINAAQRGKSLTGKLLSFSKHKITEQQAVDLNVKLLDMRALLNSMLDNDIQMHVMVYPKACYTQLDTSDFENAIVNLVLNSTFAMPDGGTLTLTTSQEVIESAQGRKLGLPVGQYVCCSVKDEGEGIAENILSKIFDPFFTTKDVRGTGLGLSQVFGFAQRSKGGISVESQVGKGTNITLYFPMDEAPKEPNIRLPRFSNEIKSKVLVVDDENELQTLVCEYLIRNDYEALGVSNAKDALEVLKTERIDTLITDIVMPGMNGFELANTVTKLYPKLNVLMTSGYNQVIDLEFVDNRDNIDFLQKPYALEDLVNSIQTLEQSLR